MGSRTLDQLLINWIIQSGHESVSLIGANERDWLVKRVRGLGIHLDFIDSDPKFPNPRDAVFDDVEFQDLIVVCNAEKHYPIGKLTQGEFIIVGDNDQHNGDCNPIDSFDKIIQQNSITSIINKEQIEKWWIVHGINN